MHTSPKKVFTFYAEHLMHRFLEASPWMHA